MEVLLASFVLASFSPEVTVTGRLELGARRGSCEVFVMVADSLWSCGMDMTWALPDGAVLANTLGGVNGFNFGREDGMGTYT